MADYLKRQNPKRRGFGKRHLYNMVKFYETYSRDEFIGITETLKLSPTVQSGIAQLDNIGQNNEFVQFPIAQIKMEKMLAYDYL